MEKTKKAIDPNSRNWEKSDIDLDPRFKQCSKEAWIVYIMMIILTVGSVFIAFVTGSELKFILGLPSWSFYAAVWTIIFGICMIIVLNKVFRHMSLQAEGEIESPEK